MTGHSAINDRTSTLQAVRLVAGREFTERLRDRSFLISTVVTVLILLAVAVLPRLLGFGEPPTFDVATSGPRAEAERAAIEAQAAAFDVDVQLRSVDDAEAARTHVDDGTLDAAVIGDDVVVKEELDAALGNVLQTAHSSVVSVEQLAEAGIDPGDVQDALDVPPLAVDAIDPPEEGAETRSQLAFVGTLLLYGQIVGYGFWVALGVVEEKSSRVVEVLLSAIPARALLAGKVIGIGLLGLLQLVVIAVVGLTGASLFGTIRLDSAALYPVALVLIWFVLGYLFYSCLFAAAAARVSRQEEMQNATTPLTMLVLVSFFAAIYVGQSPDSTAATVLSIVPPFSSLTQPALLAGGEIPLWQSLTAVLLMVIASLALVVIAARLYEGSVLRMGAKVSLRDAWGSRRPPQPQRS
jgi:ABC-2 type transport system permease protein